MYLQSSKYQCKIIKIKITATIIPKSKNLFLPTLPFPKFLIILFTFFIKSPPV